MEPEPLTIRWFRLSVLMMAVQATTVMQQITLEEATLRLPQWIAEHEAGEEVVITRDCQPVARLIVLPQTSPHPKRGIAKNMNIYIADDFDAPLEDFKEYMP